MPESPHPVRRVLLATDLSARCDRASDRAVQLAAKWGARLHVLTVIEPVPPFDDEAEAVSAAVAKARTAIEQNIDAPADIGAEIHVAVGAAEQAILDHAEQIGADLIVTGASGSDWFGQTLLGGTVRTLTRHSRVPVLLVKRPGGQPYRSVIATTDLSDASRAPAEVAARVFPDTSLTVFHAFSMPFRSFAEDSKAYEAGLREGITAEVREALMAWSIPGAADIPVIAQFGDAAPKLAELAAAQDIDVVVAGTHGRTGMMSVLLGSVAERILETAPCDVMIVPSSGAWPMQAG